MGKPTGFLEIERHDRSYAPVEDRLRNYREFVLPLVEDDLKRQGARCMDCGVPYCHEGCPVNNIIPDWNDLVYRGDWRQAIQVLHSTNNFPEFTGRICPAPCEASCTLNIGDTPVTIKTIECQIVDRAWAEGWIEPDIPRHRSFKRIAVVGSGPSGLACAQQLARAGHDVAVFEKNARGGGLLRYGIPDFKLEKHLIDRRMAQMQAEGVEFHPNVHVGATLSVRELEKDYDAVVLAIGSEAPRDLSVPGRDLDGVHFAMEFLGQQNRRVSGEFIADNRPILASGKRVVVIGGGDTGSDCIGTSNRQGAKSILQVEIMPKPPAKENKALTWPDWPLKLRTSSSHEEGSDRDWSVVTKRVEGKNGAVTGLVCARTEWVKDANGRTVPREVPGSEFTVPADLILLAMGFVHPVHDGLVKDMKLALDERGNVRADTADYRTSRSKVFACGDARRGQSLVVWAIREGRQCARAVDEFLMGASELPR
ncbi:MAG: glutamate synthase subunit beta [Acidimicrobiia bacterium]|nr:glutamate synthase subunit beta [Acidimicrobiia bacterium]